MTREEILDRYRHLRSINTLLQTSALEFVSRDTIVEHARPLGLAAGKFLVADSEETMTLIFDLVLYTAREGRSRAVDRYARPSPPPPGSDEARMLEAMRRARFSIWAVEPTHATAGLIVKDLLRQEAWLMDESREANAPRDMAFAARVIEPESFVMTCGRVVPLTVGMVTEITHDPLALRRRNRAEIAQDPRFAMAVYRAAIDGDVMSRIAYR